MPGHQWHFPHLGKHGLCFILIKTRSVSLQTSKMNNISSLPSKIKFEKMVTFVNIFPKYYLICVVLISCQKNTSENFARNRV